MIPLVEQRTDEWYDLRSKMITASDFGDALAIDKFGKKTDPKKIYEKKCGYEPPQEYDNASVFLKWGVMFEQVATTLYETRTGINVHEFGLVQNMEHTFLGASPDGISDLGIMLEIKCPYKRVITEDSILKQYYYQIQGQLDACNLEECDFLEVRFDKYENIEDFMEDYENEFHCFTSNYKEKGIIIEIADSKYVYSPFNENSTEINRWYIENVKTSSVVNITFWYLHSYSIKRVHKDKSFVNNMNIQLEDVWNNVVKYRNDKDLYIKEIQTQTKSRYKKTVQDTSINKKCVGSMFIIDPNE
tara:strand:- start:3 stop:908 length:906 start_codon:yes stop_codon:yes gene_type:complete